MTKLLSSSFTSLSFTSIGSGSKGNSTLVAYKDTSILIDCGFSVKETEKRLKLRDMPPEQLTAVLVTHEHSDHVGGVGALARKYDIPVYLTAGTMRSGRTGNLERYEIIDSHHSFTVGSLLVHPVPVPHDANEPVQYILSADKNRFGVLTDLGSITPHVFDQYQDCDALLLEANHCPEMLANGPYPEPLKYRVGGDWGHLSNLQTAAFLQQLTKPLKHLVLAHLSQQNNHLDRVEECLSPHYHKAESVKIACQQFGTEWLSIV